MECFMMKCLPLEMAPPSVHSRFIPNISLEFDTTLSRERQGRLGRLMGRVGGAQVVPETALRCTTWRSWAS